MLNQQTRGIDANVPEAVELTRLGVSGAAEAIRRGEISAENYVSALLAKARRKEGLRAFITLDEPGALSAAREADKARAKGVNAPLLGVPLGIKDSYLTAGLRTTLGVGSLRDFQPTEDADAIATLKAAGAIVLGKTNLVELSYGLTGDNGPYGQVGNPHAPDHVTGGSSSGSAAAVAAGLAPATLGGDTIGSIRVPASLCGVVGFKPTTRRWPRAGVAPISHTLDTTGVFARSVEDCVLIDQVVTGAPAAELDSRADLKGIRFAFAPRQYLNPVDPEVEAQFRNTLLRLAEAGAEIVEIDLGGDFQALALRTTWSLFFRETKASLSEFLERHAIPVAFEDLHVGLRAGVKDAWDHFVIPGAPGYLSEQAYHALTADRLAVKERMSEIFTRHGAHALIFPTTPCTAPRVERQMQFTVGGQEVDFRVLANNTIPASAAGLPGVSLPIGLDSHDLPIGLELDGPESEDRALLGLAARVEKVLRASQ
ncbi:amidase family protein [Mesorhizobium sp. XAP10]|uniref:amidase family protein n=1 Tax=unclassified Mesorhizobium TaxID=325217 RepID=UPI0023E00F74|nr:MULTISPECIES: amidase family protein [unclassified Mesorhizobium]MDF3156115.1 amidase family protein [Mesorhizobium sp. XAP10]MDF3248870.1 amidase family protein [Mesorhizobium sp. XAP4]